MLRSVPEGVVGALSGSSRAPAPVAFDPATVAAVTLSGGNLVATNTGTTSPDQGARVVASAAKTSGKPYFEAVFSTSATSPNMGVGIGTPASTYTGMGTDGTTGVILRQGGNIFTVGTLTGVGFSGMVAGSRVGIAVDLDNRLIWFRKNGGAWNANAGYSPSVPQSGGIVIPAGAMMPFVTFGGSGGVTSQVMTANFGASAFVDAVPGGYTSGWLA